MSSERKDNHHEDLVASSSETLARIIDHTELSPHLFMPIRDRYLSKLKERKYYDQDFFDQELLDIADLVSLTVATVGYHSDLRA